MRRYQHIQLMFSAGLAAITIASASNASTYAPEQKICAVGGEKFEFMALASISQLGALPDGMPLGSGIFPIQSPQCPGNGLVMYREFKPAEMRSLTEYIGGVEYKALRSAGNTPYYLAYRTAKALGDPDSVWLLLSATWEAKNAGQADERAVRYNQEYVELVMTMPTDSTSFTSIAMRARAANALRELGRFEEAEKLRTAIAVGPKAGGQEPEASENRDGWRKFLEMLAAPIARKDQSRAPIDVIGDREAMFRCTSIDFAKEQNRPAPPPLTAFEAEYCSRPAMADQITKWKTSRPQL